MSLVTASGTTTLHDTISSAFYPDFQQKVALAAAACALAIYAESSGTTNHTIRAAYARQVLSNPVLYATQSIAFAVAADETTWEGSTDQEIIDRVLAVWNALAGA